jgi:hypothetical protein
MTVTVSAHVTDGMMVTSDMTTMPSVVVIKGDMHQEKAVLSDSIGDDEGRSSIHHRSLKIESHCHTCWLKGLTKI